MITVRDVEVALLAVVATLCVIAWADESPVQRSAVFEWNSMVEKATNAGSVRSAFRGPTATLEELEIHVTTLSPGHTPQPPHTHPNEELIIIQKGTVQTLSNGRWVEAGPGSIIFNASNELHGLKNAGAIPATYHVINWKTDKTPKASPASK